MRCDIGDVSSSDNDPGSGPLVLLVTTRPGPTAEPLARQTPTEARRSVTPILVKSITGVTSTLLGVILIIATGRPWEKPPPPPPSSVPISSSPLWPWPAPNPKPPARSHDTA